MKKATQIQKGDIIRKGGGGFNSKSDWFMVTEIFEAPNNAPYTIGFRGFDGRGRKSEMFHTPSATLMVASSWKEFDDSAIKDSTMFKVTDRRTGKVRLVRATDSLEAIDKVSNISNLRGKK